MAQCQTDSDDDLLDTITVPPGAGEEDTRNFVETALDAIRSELESNRAEAVRMTDRFDEDSETVADVLDPDNVREIQVRANPFENPKVTVWLKDNPIWANHAWTEAVYPNGVNAYNGKVTTSFDVRPF